MRRKFIGVAFAALAAVLAGSAHAQDKKVTIGVSIPAADHGWTSGVVYHAERVAKLLMQEHPGLNVIVKTSPDAANQANALQDLAVQGLDALVVLPSDPDPLVNAIKEIKDKGTFVALVDRAPSVNDNSIRDLYVAGNNPALGQVAGEYIKKTTPDAEVVVIRGLPIPIDGTTGQCGRLEPLSALLDREQEAGRCHRHQEEAREDPDPFVNLTESLKHISIAATPQASRGSPAGTGCAHRCGSFCRGARSSAARRFRALGRHPPNLCRC